MTCTRGVLLRAVLIGGALYPHAAEPAEMFSVQAAYTADWLSNVRGGLKDGSAYLQNLDLSLEREFATGFSSRPGKAFAYFLYNDDTTFSADVVGDAQVVSNIEAAEAARVYELWYEQPLGERWSAKFGLYDLNSEFDVIDTAALFLNGSHGMGFDFGQSGVAGPSIFPLTSLALRVNWAAGERNTLRYVVLDAVPGDPDDPSRTTIKLGNGDGVLQTLEWNWQSAAVRAAAGYWRYSAEFPRLGRLDATGAPREGKGNDGFYAFAEGDVPGPAASGGARWFVRYGRADDSFNTFGDYLGLGLVFERPFALRGTLGLAVASAGRGDASRRLDPAGNDRETTFEVTYQVQLAPWLQLQPDLQYVVNPGTNPELKDALIVGLRLILAKTWNL